MGHENTGHQRSYRLIEDGGRLGWGRVRSKLKMLGVAYYEAEDVTRIESRKEEMGRGLGFFEPD